MGVKKGCLSIYDPQQEHSPCLASVPSYTGMFGCIRAVLSHMLLLQAVWSARKRTMMSREMSNGATAMGRGLGEEPATMLLSPL